MSEEKIKKLDRLLSLLDPEESLTKTDFTDAFKKVVELILKIQERQEKAIQQLFSEHDKITGEFRNHYTSNLSQLKGQVNSLFVSNRLQEIEDKNDITLAEVKKIVNDTLEKKLNEMDIGMTNLINEMKDETNRKKTELDLHLKTMQYDGKLDADKTITAFKEEYKKDIKELKDLLQKINSGRSHGGRAKIYFQQWVDLTASVNGSTTVFTLPTDTVRVHGLLSTQFPQLWRTTDYTLSGNTLTTNFTMQSGQSLIAVCEVLFYSKT